MPMANELMGFDYNFAFMPYSKSKISTVVAFTNRFVDDRW